MAVHAVTTKGQMVEPLPSAGILISVTAGVTRRVGRVLGVVLAALAAGHVVAMLWSDALGNLSVLNLVNEVSVGTWVSTVALLACAVLSTCAAMLARRERSRWVANWWLLAGVFALMSLDEVAAIHERFSTPVRRTLGADADFLYYAWVIPALLFVAVFFAVQVRFLRNLDAATRRGLVLAGLAFVVGAAGLEMVEAALETDGLQHTVGYLWLVLVEELMETGAIMWAGCILLAHLVRRFGQPVITLEPAIRPAG